MLKKQNYISSIRNNGGSFTVELALIFPVVIFGIVVTLYVLLILYQYAFLQALANKAAFRAAAEYGSFSVVGNHHEKNQQILEVGSETAIVAGQSLYWQLGIFDNTEVKKQLIEVFIKERINNYQLLKPQEEMLNVKIYDYIIYKKLRVQIISEYKLPVVTINNIFGFKNTITLRVEGEAVIKDCPELIRNADFLLNLMDRIDGTADIKESYFKMLETWRNNISNVLKE